MFWFPLGVKTTGFSLFDMHGERRRSHSAVVVVDRDGHRIVAIVRVGVASTDGACGRHTGPPFTSAMLAPVIASRPSPQFDVVRERLVERIGD